MSKNIHSNLIEQYVDGTISAGDKQFLENQMAADPILKEEVTFQQNVVSGLKAYRKAELKARLDNVPVEVGVVGGSAGSSSLFKMAASIGTAALVAGGIYYFSRPASRELIDFPAREPINEMMPLTAEEQPAPMAESLPKIAPAKKAAPAVYDAPKEAPVAESPAAIAFEKPSVKEFSDSDAFEPEQLNAEELPKTKMGTLKTPVNIEVKSKPGYGNKLMYQFYEEKLYLYGDFGDIPYEILEINGRKGKRTYLYHKNNYYRLEYPTSKLTALEKITNEKLIKELNIFRENKALD